MKVINFLKIPLIVAGIAVLVFFGGRKLIRTWKPFHHEDAKVVTITESELEKVVREGTLYTAEYPYNSYVTASDDKGEIKYYAAYNGTVKAGFDTKQVEVSLDAEKNLITVHLPEIQVDATVDPGSMEFIFQNDKYNTDTVASEAYSLAEADLAEKAKQDDEILQAATNNAKAVEKEFIEPWVNQVSPDTQYRVEVLAVGEASPEG